MGQKILIIACLIALTGCKTVGLTSSFCDPRSGIEAIRLTPAERAALDPTVKRNILAINAYGAANCGW